MFGINAQMLADITKAITGSDAAANLVMQSDAALHKAANNVTKCGHSAARLMMKPLGIFHNVSPGFGGIAPEGKGGPSL